MKSDDVQSAIQAVKALYETIRPVVGAVLGPWWIPAHAKADAKKMKVLASALRDIAKEQDVDVVYKDANTEMWTKPDGGVLSIDAMSIEKRSKMRVEHQECRRQRNIESVTSVAAGHLLDAPDIPEERPDEDWVARFFECAQEVGSEEMQELWGRILSGEVTRPGSYSLRTLDCVRNLTASDASVFVRVGRLALNVNGQDGVPRLQEPSIPEQYRLSAQDFIELVEAGLMNPSRDIGVSFRFDVPEDERRRGVLGQEYGLVIEHTNLASDINFPLWKFTAVGAELLTLVSRPYDEAYLVSVAKFFQKKGAKVFLARVKGRRASKVRFNIERELTLQGQ